MKAPDKLYVREYPDGICRVWEDKKKDDVIATILHEYIRKDALLEWAKTKLSNIQEDFDVYTEQRIMLRELIEKIESI